MVFRVFLLLLVWVLLTAAAVAEGDWVEAWEDDFNRSSLGDEWIPLRGSRSSLVDGRLLLEGGGATLITSRTFASDVRIEFEAEAKPGVPPCDLSATIGANPTHGYGYLFAFGGHSNQANQIIGPGVATVDRNPPFVIEHGKVYRCIATREGKRLTYTVDGRMLIDARTTDAAAGPGFDRVGLVTWAGMYVDNFRVYERKTPHPDTPIIPRELPPIGLSRDGRKLLYSSDEYLPGAEEAVNAFNAGDLPRALRLFREIGDATPALVGQAYVMCDLAYPEKLHYVIGEPNPDFQQLADGFARAAASRPDDKALAAYAGAAAWLSDLIMSRKGLASAVRLRGLGEKNNPFYFKARLYEARYHYWNGKEGGAADIIAQAVKWMSELKQTWPENAVLRQYTGEQVPWGEELIADTNTHPAWAAHLREAYARQVRLMEVFFEKRQAPDGQLGGGYGDDVELMRTWMQIASISSAAAKARAGIECLAEGVWNHECRDGYATDIGDVEHSAEPSADVFPAMLLLRYGDPLWVERNLTSCSTIKNRFMGIDNKGFPRFISSEFGSDGVRTNPRAGGDTGYSARAMKHFIWQGWWGDREARDWFVDWCEGWRKVTLAQVGTKIPGFPPPTIWYPSGEITPPTGAPWYDATYNYYGSGGMGGMILDSFLVACMFTGDHRFLEPIHVSMRYGSGPIFEGSFPAGSLDWQRQALLHTADPQRAAIYRWLTGERVYDEYTLRGGDPAQVYRTNYDLAQFTRSFEQAARMQRYDLELQTTEVLSTDRAALQGAMTVFGAYTGAISGLRDASAPTFAVTYDTPSTDFAAMVTESTPSRIRLWLYNFAPAPMNIRLKFWQLSPGIYVLEQGKVLPGEREGQQRYDWQEATQVVITHRADGAVVQVPPGVEWAVDLRLREAIPVPDAAPDLAISEQDIASTAEGLQVTVHNLGNAASAPATLAIGESRITVAAIPPPSKLRPSSVVVDLPYEKNAYADGSLLVELDPENAQYELCESNNAVRLPLIEPTGAKSERGRK